MLRCMCGVTKIDKTRNEHVRGSVKVGPVTKKITEKRRDEGHIPRSMLDAPVPGKRRRGRPKTSWKDSCNRDKKGMGFKGGGHIGQHTVEDRNPKPFRRPQMMGKSRGEGKKNHDCRRTPNPLRCCHLPVCPCGRCRG